MAEYQRFISYMYLYEGDTKGRNTGFVKVEARGYYRRIEAVVRRQPLLDGLASVWAFYRDGNFCRGILLGRMTISGGNGNFLWSSLKDTVENSSCQFEELAGMLIWSERNENICVTLWDDFPFSIGLFSPEREEAYPVEAIEPTVEVTREQEPETIETVVEQEEFQEEAVEQEEEFIEETTRQEEEFQEEEMEQEGELIEEAAEPEEEFPKEAVEEDAREVALGQTEKVQEEVMEPEEEVQEVVGKQGQVYEETANELCTEPKTGELLEQELAKPEQMEKEDSLIEEKSQEQELDVDLEKFFPRENSSWEKLCSYYPKIKPFAWNKNMYCLRIKPGDLGRLPKENWIMGNNSFMLHGYYVYRYLILMQLEQGESKRYILGVPGIYGNRERFMADMFGFREFISINQKRVVQGQKGFWCVDIKV